MCTDFLLQAADEDDSVVNGRSMEFGEDLGSQILIGGRGTKKQSAAPDSPKGGLSWIAKYGYVGLNVAKLGLPKLICDGMNEKGLSIGPPVVAELHPIQPDREQQGSGLGCQRLHQLGARQFRDGPSEPVRTEVVR